MAEHSGLWPFHLETCLHGTGLRQRLSGINGFQTCTRKRTRERPFYSGFSHCRWISTNGLDLWTFSHATRTYCARTIAATRSTTRSASDHSGRCSPDWGSTGCGLDWGSARTTCGSCAELGRHCQGTTATFGNTKVLGSTTGCCCSSCCGSHSGKCTSRRRKRSHSGQCTSGTRIQLPRCRCNFESRTRRSTWQ